MIPIDQCGMVGCGGRLSIISLDRNERIRRRIGQAMIGRCKRCGHETTVVKSAWMTFVKNRRVEQKAEAEADQEQLQLNLF